jgi:hypothetical protein
MSQGGVICLVAHFLFKKVTTFESSKDGGFEYERND